MKYRTLLLITLVAVAGLVAALRWGSPGRSIPGGSTRNGKGGVQPPLVFYCAAGVIRPVEEVAHQYEQAYGVPIQIEPGGSGKLLATLRTTRGRGHLYLAADDSYIQRARDEFDLVAESIPVARIYPVIAVKPGNPKKIHSVADLYRNDVRLVLANPELASVGQTVKERLEPTGDWAKIMAKKESGGAKVSFTGTVNEVAQALKIGAADAGVIWNSLVGQFNLESVETDVLGAEKRTITIGILKDADRPTAALQFARYLTSRDRGMPHFARYGFEPIADADRWEEHPEIPIMAGAMLKPGIEEALKRFEQREGVTIKPVYNGCGILVSQMKAGAKPDVYISCDNSFLAQVQERFDPPVELSRNPMVIVVPKGNPKGIKTLEDLARKGLRIGLAHPVNSALGALTDRMLNRIGLHEKIYREGNRVIHTNAAHMLINQMRTGALDACVAYISNVRSAPQNADFLETIPIPLPDAIATQPYAVSKESDHRYLMYRLRDAITAAETGARFKSLGFTWIYDTSQ